MERSPMLVDWQNQYHENGYTTKAIYMFNAIHQIYNDILHRDRKLNPTVHMETQKTLNS
jgi:hypothetical protein